MFSEYQIASMCRRKRRGDYVIEDRPDDRDVIYFLKRLVAAPGINAM